MTSLLMSKVTQSIVAIVLQQHILRLDVSVGEGQHL